MRDISYSESVSDRGAKIIPFPVKYKRTPEPRLQREKVFLKVGVIVCGIFLISLIEYVLVWVSSLFMNSLNATKLERQSGT